MTAPRHRMDPQDVNPHPKSSEGKSMSDRYNLLGDTERPAATRWHLDKTLPLGLIGGLFLQTATVVWFMSALFTHVDQLARDAAQQAERIRTVEQSSQAQAVAGATFATQISGISDTLQTIQQDQRAQLEMLRQILQVRK